MDNFWDVRYSQNEYAYGTAPNEFFRDELQKLKPGKILLLGEGEGRNAVYAAALGWQVDALDISEKGKEKALLLAKKNNVSINYKVQNLEQYIPLKEEYDAAGIIFLHFGGSLRNQMHSVIIDALKPGGKLILEVFDKDQIRKASGGPRELNLLYSVEEIHEAFSNLKIELIERKNIILSEGPYHSGDASVIRLVAAK